MTDSVTPLGSRPRRTAQRFDTSVSTIWRLLRAGELEAIHLSDKCTLITEESIQALLARRRAEAQK